MVVKNTKAKGTKLEHDFRRYFEKWGYHVIRAAGSFGIDLIAIKKDHPPILINVKWLKKYLSKSEKYQMLEDARKTGGIPVLAYKHVPKGKKNGKHCIERIFEVNNLASTVVLVYLERCPSWGFDVWFLGQRVNERVLVCTPPKV